MPAASRLPVPLEIVHEVIRHLRLSSTCSSCLQTDLAALCASSRALNAVATPYLYSSINLATLHNQASYTARLHSLLDTLSTAGHLAGHVRSLQLSHLEPATKECWSKLVVCTPNLRVLQGVDSFFPPDADYADADEAGHDFEAAMQIVAALQKLTAFQKMVLHQEVSPVRLSQLLGNGRCWPQLHTLALGCVVAEGSTFSDLSVLGAQKHLEHLFFYDVDLDYATPTEADDALAHLPPLRTLSIQYSLGFSLDGVARFLRQSPAHARRLHALEFRHQLRHANSPVGVAAVLREAVSLRKLNLSLTRRGCAVEQLPDRDLASASLEELVWTGVYNSPEAYRASAPDGRFDDFVALVIASLPQLPALRRFVVGVEICGVDPDPLVFAALRAECARDASPLTLDPAELGAKPGKRVLLELLQAVERCNARQIEEMKHGVLEAARDAPPCAVLDTDKKPAFADDDGDDRDEMCEAGNI